MIPFLRFPLERKLQPSQITELSLREGPEMKYGVAWLLGVPVSLIALWFVANQMGCGL
jgi:hypothetical protein